MVHCTSCRRELEEKCFVLNEKTYKTCNECRQKRNAKRRAKKLTLRECQELAEERGGLCLSEEYVNSSTKMRWECSEGHQWESSFSGIKNNGHWCPRCSGKAKLSIEECQELAAERGGLCLSEEYVNNRTKMRWECADGHQWSARFHDIKNGATWCPHCASSKSERVCREIFEKIFEKEFPKKRPDWLGGLELDGFCEELGIAFEYMGLQHYEFVPHFHRNGEQDLLDQKARDIEKRRLCFEREIKLIIVPYCYRHNDPEQMELFIRDSTRFIRN